MVSEVGYSLLQTCLVSGIDGSRYLSALLVELPNAKTVEDFENLLPLAPRHCRTLITRRLSAQGRG